MKTAQPNLRRHGLAFKLSLLVLASTTAIFLAAFAYNYWCASRTVLEDVEQIARNLTSSTVFKIETVLRSVEEIPLFMAAQMESHPFTEEEIKQNILDMMNSNADIFGSTVSFEPYAFYPSVLYFAPYYYRKDGKYEYNPLGGETYRYHEWDWYSVPKELNKPIWSEPYYDESGGKVIMSTYSVPFYQKINGERVFRGIVTADISLEWLVNLVSKLKVLQSGFSFMITQDGTFVTHPDTTMVMKESIFSLAERQNDRYLRELGKKMIRGETDFVRYRSVLLNKTSWMCYFALPSTGWSIGVVFPEDELYAELRRLSETIILIGLAGFAMLFVVVIVISGAITKPIRSLAHTTTEIAKGNLDVALPTIRSNDEVGDLSRSFEDMRVALKEYINDLTVTTAAKERIESELKIAHTIQMSFLPKHFPPFPEHDEFEIFATLEPAKEVGGDLYDFFLQDKDHLFFVIGDVTDKGVPAALFMAVSKTLIKGIAEHGLELDLKPSDILMRVNDELAIDNDSSMFVTIICGELNFRTGHLRYSNAAHSKPVIIRNGQKPDWLDLPGGFLLGPMMGSQYETFETDLNPGDVLLLFTDGVDEATNVKQEFYGKQKILDTVEKRTAETAEELVHEVMASVKSFAEGAPQSDDITLLSLKYYGPK